MIRAFLYEADGEDREVDLTPELLASLGDQSLVWVDLASRSPDDIRAAGSVLNIEPSSISDLLKPKRSLRVDNYGAYYQFSLFVAPTASASTPNSGEAPHTAETGRAAAEGDEESSRLCFVVGDRWLLTVHDEELEFLRGFREQDKAETKIGALTPQALAASLLDWHLEAFFGEVARIEVVIDKLDERVLAEPTSAMTLGRMLAVRRHISRLRRLLAVQRAVFYGLGRPDLMPVVGSEAGEYYETLTGRFERAVDEVERTRELVLGSFELFTSRTTQQTNDLVKTLTFVTVIIGSAAAIAGLFGMNFDPPFFQTGSAGFFAVSGGLFALGLGAWVVARRRRWI